MEGDTGLVIIDCTASVEAARQGMDLFRRHVIGDQAGKSGLRIGYAFTDLDETWTATVRRGVLNARRGTAPGTQLTVSGPKAVLTSVILNPATASRLVQAGKIRLDGDETALETLAGLMDTFDPDFSIVTP